MLNSQPYKTSASFGTTMSSGKNCNVQHIQVHKAPIIPQISGWQIESHCTWFLHQLTPTKKLFQISIKSGHFWCWDSLHRAFCYICRYKRYVRNVHSSLFRYSMKNAWKKAVWFMKIYNKSMSQKTICSFWLFNFLRFCSSVSTFMEFQIMLAQHQLLLIRWKKSEECIFFLISLRSPNCVNSKLKLNQARFPTDGVNR